MHGGGRGERAGRFIGESWGRFQSSLGCLMGISASFCPHSNKGMEHLLSMKCKNMVPVYDLLLEMLNAHTLRGHKSSVTGSKYSPAEKSKSKEGSQNSRLSDA